MNLFPPPGPERRRALGLLVLLAVALGAYFGPQYWPSKAAAAVPSSNTEGRTQSSDKAIPLPEPVKLGDLDPAPDAAQSARNPFRFGEKPKPPAPPPPPEPPYKPPLPVTPPLPQGPPEIKLKCLGIEQILNTKQWMGNMQDPESGASWWVKDGDVIDGKYKIVKVTADTVTVSYRDGTGQKTVRKGGI